MTVLLAVLLSASALTTGTAWARAGGGDNYSSGSSDSGSSFSSDSSYSGSSSSGGTGSGSDLPDAAAYLIVAVIVFMVLHVLWRIVTEGFATPPAADSARGRFGEVSEASVRGLAAFKLVQAAWSDGDMTPACGVLSDGTFERFQTLLAMNRADGKVNKVSELTVTECSVESEGRDGGWDRTDLRITAGCIDEYHDAATGQKLSGGQSWFTEYWGFLRRAGARPAGPGLPEQGCPNCGQAVAVNRTAVCPQCKSWLNSGEHGWVLAEITQQDEWDAGGARDDALEALRKDDPALSVQELEDRASALFWRWLACLVERSPARLQGVAGPGLAAALEGLGRHRFLDVGVGSVRVRAASESGGTQTVGVSVKWRGRRAPFDAGGAEGPALYITLLTFARRSGVLTDVRVGLRSLHCAGCGAAQEPAQPLCAQCGRAFNDVALGWVLTALETRSA